MEIKSGQVYVQYSGYYADCYYIIGEKDPWATDRRRTMTAFWLEDDGIHSLVNSNVSEHQLKTVCIYLGECISEVLREKYGS